MAKFVEGAPEPTMSMANGLAVHHQPETSRDALVTFIHGLGGSGYGTWGQLPGCIYRDAYIDADVGIFDYVSGLRRRPRFSPDLNEVVRELLSQLESLQYQRLVLVGHSMGGIVASTLLRRSHELSLAQDKAPVVQRTVGLFALASPRAGARAVLFGGWKDARFLRSHNEVVAANEEFFTNQVNARLHGGSHARFHIPVWAANATGDRHVDRFTATHGVPADQVDTFPGSHSSFLHGEDLINWVRKNCRTSLVPPRPGAIAAATVYTRFRGHPMRGDWHDTFHRAVQRFLAMHTDLTIYDLSHEPRESHATDLQVRVLPSDNSSMLETRAEIESYGAEMAAGSLFALAVAPYGSQSEEAAKLVTSWVASRTAWVQGIDRTERLEDEIVRWLARTSHSLALAGRLRVVDRP